MPRTLFTDSEDRKLIENVKKYQVLFDRDHIDFRNSTARHHAWKKVGSAVGKDYELCKRRWRDIRDNYSKIIRKYKESTGVRPPTWPLFESLEFLNNEYNKEVSFSYSYKESTDNKMDHFKKESDNDEGMITDEEEAFSSTRMADSSHGQQPIPDAHQSTADTQQPTTDGQQQSNLFFGRTESESSTNHSVEVNTIRKAKRNRSDDARKRSQQLIDLDLLRCIAKMKEDEDDVDVFMKSIAMSLKKLPPHFISQAKIEILTVVSRFEDQAFSRTSQFPADQH